MYIFTATLLDYTDNLTALFVINLFNILDDKICHTVCKVFSFFAQLQESCKNLAIHRWRQHSVEKTLPYRIESNKIRFSVKTCFKY